ncbi:MAG: KpsF/GutQ family sugar-phosphate isomerase [Bacteroidota bacterium]|nr:KpsF/GutQ family sugar-phosphate isomerase [Bacteroidota bacterium]
MRENKFDIIKSGKETIKEEVRAIDNLISNINKDFEEVVKLIYKSKGRVIITGIGKSANIGLKIVSTLNSTGTPAFFMHAADAVHGDLGIIRKDDIVICISKSGNTPEIKVLIPIIKHRGNTLIAIVGNTDSFLAQQSNYILNTTVTKEACPNNLAPTSSTTAQLVMGDALAVSLLEYRGFTAKDFAQYHPGGSLGKQLYLKASDIYPNNEIPKVDINDSAQNVIIEISSKRLGLTAVMKNGDIAGIITDGDLRRMLEKGLDIGKTLAKDIMSLSPKTVDSETLVSDTLDIMRSNDITQILITKDDKYVGVVHLHDILKEGIL